ncbi:hypothetical protein B0H14DRAFT_3484978 [Mycena olivaceomarginata]|nr:hypothetical protein B0H14DRAFT_3484978 [Mycena olivaceomarginata]
MPKLVDMAPFSFAAADDHCVFMGRKATAEVVVELETGAIRFGGADTCLWGGLDERDGQAPPPKRREVVVRQDRLPHHHPHSTLQQTQARPHADSRILDLRAEQPG